MAERAQAQAPAPVPADPATTIGVVTLSVADLDNMIKFYHQIIGLMILDRTARKAVLGLDETPLINLEACPTGKRHRRATGLFHLALLLPSRQDLGHWLRHLAASSYPLEGVGDHLVSEALYLSDPEDNGLEIYRDRPRETWTYDHSGLRMDTLAIDVSALLAEAPEMPFTGLPAGTTIGHIHLQVDDVGRAVDFYREVVGFDLMMSLPGAAFLSAGGYHHHLGLNSWHSSGATAPPAGSLGLLAYQIVLPTLASREAVLARADALDHSVEKSRSGPLIRDTAGNDISLVVRG